MSVWLTGLNHTVRCFGFWWGCDDSCVCCCLKHASFQKLSVKINIILLIDHKYWSECQNIYFSNYFLLVLFMYYFNRATFIPMTFMTTELLALKWRQAPTQQLPSVRFIMGRQVVYMYMKVAQVNSLTTRSILIILREFGSLQIAIPPFDAMRYTTVIRVECTYSERDGDSSNIIIFMVSIVLFYHKNL